jgi:hypothetical protein
MSGVFTSAGSVVSLGDAAPATYDKAGFEAVTWGVVGEITQVPEFGRVYTGSQHKPLASRKTVKRKGSYNDGSTTMQYGVDEADTGQASLEALVDNDADQAFRIVLQTLKHLYFTAQIMSNPITIGSVDDITTKSVQLEITGEVLFEVAPT